MNYEIKGTPFPVVECTLSKGEKMITESGSMVYMDDAFKMETSGGGLAGMFGKAFSGESMFQNFYTAKKENAMIAFGSSFPGRIVAVTVDRAHSYICQKSAFLASEESVQLSIHFKKKLGTGFFGGEGFIMQKLQGNGVAFLEFDGEIIEKNLAPGEKIVLDTGYLAMMDGTCQMDIVKIQGAKNILFGGEGLFNTVVTGPGRVWIQTLPFNQVASRIIAMVPSNN